MKALVLMHVENEGPGTLGTFLEEQGSAVTTLHLYRGDRIPAGPRNTDLVVSMGGPMNVYEDEKHPFLREEVRFLRQTVDAGVPLLGICLGAQLVARACGARVYKARVGETGWGTVALTEAGREDPLLRDLPETMPVLQWHEDTFDIPAGGELLARSTVCPHQAFRIKEAWGLQFHVEVDREMLAGWFEGKDEREEILRRCDEMREEFDDGARRLYAALLARARGGQ